MSISSAHSNVSDDDRSSVSSDTSRTRSSVGSFRSRLKSTTERGRVVIEGTKTVSSRLVKTLRRRSAVDDIQHDPVPVRSECFSMPSCDVFDTITFDFPPLNRSNATSHITAIDDFDVNEQKLLESANRSSSSDNENLPPPQYPPPPLPEGYCEDDVFSLVDSTSILKICRHDFLVSLIGSVHKDESFDSNLFKAIETKEIDQLLSNSDTGSSSRSLESQDRDTCTSGSLPAVLKEFDPLSSMGTLLSTDSSDGVLASGSEDDAVGHENGRSGVLQSWTNMKRAWKGVAGSSSSSKELPETVREPATIPDSLRKPDVNINGSLLHNGFLFRSASNSQRPKDLVPWWCRLADGKLYYSLLKSSVTKESVDLNDVASICLLQGYQLNPDGNSVYCFELNVSNRTKPYIFGASCTTERRVWMQKIMECLTPAFSTKYTVEYNRAGWCFLKENFNGEWIFSWLLLQERTLVYWDNTRNELHEIDLRKLKIISLQNKTEDVPSDECKQLIKLDTVYQSLYVTMIKQKEVTEWQRAIKAAAVDNGVSLESQQLTKDNVPVIVEKCVSFVYAYGSMVEGIYRRSGSHSGMTRLLSLFRQDSWAVQLSRQEYNEYEVASVLKRFFRELSEPLLSTKLHKHICNAAGADCSEEDQLLLYRNILEQLPPINYVTVRKLIGHLFFIHEQREMTLMPAQNLAAVWGPSLMHVDNTESNQWCARECKAVSDLITLYPKLFLIDNDELERENKFREVLEKFQFSSASAAPQPIKPSGDLRIWIYLHSKESGECVNIALDPNKTCGLIYEELSEKMKMETHSLCLQEVICNGELMRPMHHSERVLDTVIRWSYWDENDRKDNYLLLTDNGLLQKMQALAKSLYTVCYDLKFADTKMKSMKMGLVEFDRTSICWFKDIKNLNKVKEWKVQDIIWYLGSESRRNVKMRWAITFISRLEKQTRTKDHPYFGYTLAGSNKEEQLRIIATIMSGQYPNTDLLPPVSLLK